MGSRCLSRSLLAAAALAAALLTPARAGEPSARELIALAPVLDSSDRACRSLDVGGYYGDDNDPGPRLRFRALYRAPHHFSLLLTDAADGTPLAFCSDRKMLVYDPVGPTLYYSENASFTLEMACTDGEIKVNWLCLLKSSRPHHIRVDLRSMLPGLPSEGQAADDGAFEDRVVKRNTRQFELIRNYEKKAYLTLDVNLAKECPYTAVTFVQGGTSFFRLDALALNGALGDEWFAFPAKERLARELPLKDVTAVEDLAAIHSTAAAVGRACMVRWVFNKPGPPGPRDIPGLQGVDWDRVKRDDKKYANALRHLVRAR